MRTDNKIEIEKRTMDSEKPSDEITEEEFDALLDSIEASKNVAEDGSPSAHSESETVATEAGSNDEITESEFDDLLDRLAAEKNASGDTGSATETAPSDGSASAAIIESPNDEITEAEFDDLLDHLAAEKNTAAATGSVTEAVVDEYIGELCADADESKTLVLQVAVGIANAAAIHRELVEFSNGEGAVTIDGSNVESIDSAGLQLMLAFWSEMKQQERTVKWHEPSPIVIDNAAALGLSEFISLPAIDAAA